MNVSPLYFFGKIALCAAILSLLGLWAAELRAQDSVNLMFEKERLTKDDLAAVTMSEATKLVSVSRSAKRLDELPVTVYVITHEEIVKNGYVTLVDVLKSVPGIRVSQPGAGDLGEMFMMRGQIGNQYAKILLNNVPLQPSVNGGLPIAAQLPIAQAERIEIIYGPAAAVYGGDAVAGVINIITQKAEKGVFAQANSYFGTDSYRHLNFIFGGKLGRDKDVLQYSIYANRTQRDDLNIRHTKDPRLFNTFGYLTHRIGGIFDQIPPEIYQQFENFATENPDLFVQEVMRGQLGLGYYVGTPFEPVINALPQSSELLGVQVNYRNFQFSLEEMQRKDHSAIGRSPLFFSMRNPETYLGERIRRTTLSYQNSWSKWALAANLSYLNYRADVRSSFAVNYESGFDGRAYKYEASDDIFGEAILTYRPSNYVEWTGGFSIQASSNLPTSNDLGQPFNELDYKPFQPNYRPAPQPTFGYFGYNPLAFFNVGGFVQRYYTGKKWNWVVGLRADGNSKYGGIIYPRVAALRKLSEKSSLRLSYAAARKLPAASQSFVSLAVPVIGIGFSDSVSYQQIPNTNLKPEFSTTLEVGYRNFLNKKITFDAGLYFVTTQNHIVSRFVPIDTLQYPNAVANDDSSPTGRSARSFINDENSLTTIVGLQLMVQMRNIIPVLKLDLDLAYQSAFGFETLPGTGDFIPAFRMQPRRFFQGRIAFSPHKRFYVNIQNVISSGFYRRYLTSRKDFDDDAYFIKGYFTSDVHIRYQINKNFHIFTRAINLFNREYAGIDATGFDVDLWYNPQLMRNVQIGLSFRID
ncbi:TonB-dependent receptor plug domain-containing protein [Hugenholtzia roseola]|uniref:TonB-dependent receptor plug domain-containing protein n=1 Tax=Hugenholtzia roseola TaxID=1002 RepID=UPI00047C00F4|nr:TonB-dependent receptor [Hugenholtzia roseola]